MIKHVVAVGLAIGVAAPGLAQTAPVPPYRAQVEACWDAAGGDPARAEACTGMLSQACMAYEPAGMSNTGMSRCLADEAAFWDEKLNEVWAQVVPLVAAADAADRDSAPGYAVRKDKLREAQRAWIAFRDAHCAFQYAIHGDGSIRLLYYPSCLSDMTFRRVQDLLIVGAEFGG